MSSTTRLPITIRYFAAARAAAGVDTERVEIDAHTSIADLEGILAAAHPDLAPILARCSYLRDEIALRHRDRPLLPCDTVDVLPPFAGG
ncbi:MoaD/ThiS family protein [Gordonia sp. ABSL1-1]|uniref:MoaD/ThiS family protein n=1 Tax=Gordonia sp. ABSL1-1 TaxID=3053923 RepID=UPI0025742C7D|nr:MoaD/ThiS family protein [Gordonia sp. ABSL1-1]MDL9937813.1 MoaD/ThiS family protein [Gordonia sp. ABSL1-1]